MSAFPIHCNMAHARRMRHATKKLSDSAVSTELANSCTITIENQNKWHWGNANNAHHKEAKEHHHHHYHKKMTHLEPISNTKLQIAQLCSIPVVSKIPTTILKVRQAIQALSEDETGFKAKPTELKNSVDPLESGIGSIVNLTRNLSLAAASSS